VVHNSLKVTENSCAGTYRFGFQGQEKENGVYGEGDLYTAQFWEYDTRIGRRWNVDPVVKEWESPFACFAGNPIWFADPDGADTIVSPNGEKMNAGTGYSATMDGKFLVGEGLQTKVWDPTASSSTTGENTGNYTNLVQGESYNIPGGTWSQIYNDSNGGGEILKSNLPTFQKSDLFKYWLVNNADRKTFEDLAFQLVMFAGGEAMSVFSTYGKLESSFARYEGIAARSAAKTSTSLVQANRTAGNLFRDELAAALRAEGRTVNTEVFKRTPFGPRYMDLDVWHKGVNLGGIETKVGGSRYLPLQRLKDAWLGANGYPVNLVRKPGTW